MSRRSLHSQSSREGGFSANLHSPSTVRLEGFTNIFQQEGSNAAVCLFGLERSKAVSCDCYEDEGYMECCMPDVDEVDIDDDGQVPVRGVVGKAEAPILRVSFRHKRVQAEDVVIGEVTVSGKFEKLQQNILGWLRREGWEQRHRYRWRLIDQCVAEMLGTMFIVIFGVGSVCSAVLTEYNAGLWQVAVVWGFGVALAIHSTASVSGAHLNPAVSLAFAMFRPRDFGWSKLIPYWIAQYLGAIVGGCFNLLVYGPQFRHYEKVNNIVRGSKESIITASAFGEYFPNPGFDSIVGRDAISPLFAMLVEAWGTGILMFMILALIDSRHKIMKQTAMIPFFIGFTVAVLISLYAPLTQGKIDTLTLNTPSKV